MTKFQQNKYFHLFANCVPVKGAKNSIICDLQRNNFHFIPQELCEAFISEKFSNIAKLKAHFQNKFDSIIEENLLILEREDLGFFSNQKESNFPKINFSYDPPSLITNAIIDFEKFDQPMDKVTNELNSLGCKAVQLRFFSKYSLKQISQILGSFNESQIESIELIYKYIKEAPESHYTLAKSFERISSISVHSSPENKLVQDNNIGETRIVQTDVKLKDETCCGLISPDLFSVNITMFSESLNWNSCLNKKISIDKKGEIKNCPSLRESYGNINSSSLIDVVKSSNNFKDLWKVKKDIIDDCKVCEFRYICSDCRAYTKGSKPLAKPEKCNYDPHKGKWQEN